MALNQANFMRCIVRDTGNFQALDLKPMDQCALSQAIQRKDEHRRASNGFGISTPMSSEDWKKRMEALSFTGRRLDRGGMTLTKRDALEHY